MIHTVLAALRCPVCHEALHRSDGSLRCPRGHSFDRARQGYVHLGTGRKLPEGDTADMVAARSAFLQAGHYQGVRTTVAGFVPPSAALIADIGAGTGYYLAGALDAAPDAAGIALDVAKPALRRAARVHPRAEAVLADVWAGLPLADGCLDVLLNVFAPRNGAEFRRVLRPDGRLVVVTPLPRHLAELRERYGLLDVDPDKAERLAATLREFDLVGAAELEFPLRLTPDEVRALIGMGPNAFHSAVPDADAVTTVTAAVRVAAYAPAGG
ncbi:putative RNA methyltransferase [Hamadaea sp. NPDC051192]|uniref:putative RNA methyltransferase n=1 Tax=Hamadaea sp. NPDC051192 TaxID=3154940 RepID=UPI0034394AA3